MNPRRRRIRRLVRRSAQRLSRAPAKRKLKLYDDSNVRIFFAGIELKTEDYLKGDYLHVTCMSAVTDGELVFQVALPAT